MNINFRKPTLTRKTLALAGTNVPLILKAADVLSGFGGERQVNTYKLAFFIPLIKSTDSKLASIRSTRSS